MPDIFISYAHVDNASVFDQQGWVTTLIENLRPLLAQRLGRKDAFADWWDTSNLQGNSSVTPEIHEAVEQASVFLMILSTGYLASPWCQEEMSLFLKKLGDQKRGKVFVVEIEKLEQGRPPALSDLLCYQFWYEESATKRTRTLSLQSGENHRQQYIHKVEDLAHDISRQLRPPPAQNKPKATSSPTETAVETEHHPEPESAAPGRSIGKIKIEVCQRLLNDWQNLADWLDVPVAERRAFPHGREAQALWEWLESRQRLGELSEALNGIGRTDLAGLIPKNPR